MLVKKSDFSEFDAALSEPPQADLNEAVVSCFTSKEKDDGDGRECGLLSTLRRLKGLFVLRFIVERGTVAALTRRNVAPSKILLALVFFALTVFLLAHVLEHAQCIHPLVGSKGRCSPDIPLIYSICFEIREALCCYYNVRGRERGQKKICEQPQSGCSLDEII